MADKSPLQIIREELPQFWQGEQAAGMRGMVKGLGDLLGISSSAEPESVMSRYPSEENAVRGLTPLAAATIPLSKAVAPIARFATRNPVTTSAALTYATEDPTMMLMNPASILASYTPEAEAVVKPKGGNWLGHVERALSNLKPSQFGPSAKDLAEELATYKPGSESYNRVLREIGLLQRSNAVNDWVGGPLTKYVKTYMGTAEDPVRKLAEQGILHVNPEELNFNPNQAIGMNLTGKSRLARAWEGASDLPINRMIARDLSPETLAAEPWTAKLAPEDTVYGLLDRQNFARDVGFTHIKDELRNAISPTSELPASLRLQPEDLKQMGMEKAVRHVAAINAWREAQQAEANLAKATNPATHTIKEYPEGYKMVELKPQSAPEGWVSEGEAYANPLNPSEPWIYPRQSLEEALKYEGDVMGHCVGGYCDPVFKGESRIFSLRDAKGRPHVTIETRPGRFEGIPREEFRSVADMTPEQYAAEMERISPYATTTQESAIKDKWLVHPQIPYFIPEDILKPAIVQIKGKGNKAPSAKYQPMIQDFIRSGDWGEIGDLANAGFLRGPGGKAMTAPEILEEFEKLPEAIKKSGMVQERINWLRNDPETAANHDFGYTLDYLRKAHPEHFAVGGSVQPAHFDDLEAFLSR